MKADQRLPDISVEAYFVGKDITFIITGGMAHIGAVATAYFDEESILVSCKQLPHHKEGKLASQMAEKAALKLQVNVTVIVGIHIDNAASEEILALVDTAQSEFQKALNKLIKGLTILK